MNSRIFPLQIKNWILEWLPVYFLYLTDIRHFLTPLFSYRLKMTSESDINKKK